MVDPKFHKVHHIVIKMGPQDLCLYLKGLWDRLPVPRDLQVLRHLFKMVLLDPRDLCLPNQDLLELKMVLCLVLRVLRYLQQDPHWVKMVPL